MDMDIEYEIFRIKQYLHTRIDKRFELARQGGLNNPQFYYIQYLDNLDSYERGIGLHSKYPPLILIPGYK